MEQVTSGSDNLLNQPRLRLDVHTGGWVATKRIGLVSPPLGAATLVQERSMQLVRSSSFRLGRPVYKWCIIAAMLSLAGVGPGRAAELPKGVVVQLPPGYEVLGSAAASFGFHAVHIVALGLKGEQATFEAARQGQAERPEHAGPRPLLVFERQSDGSFHQTGRNDHVVLRADEGGQCDPFLDGGSIIAVKGLYFTVENGVACGQHWTDYITFRFDNALGRYVFDNERRQSSSLNPSRDPNAEAMVTSPPEIRRSDRVKPVAFADWRPRP